MIKKLEKLKNRITDENNKCDKEMKYLKKILCDYDRVKKKINNVLGSEPEKYYDSDQSVESNYHFDDDDVKNGDIDKVNSMMCDAFEELIKIRHTGFCLLQKTK